MCHLSSQPCLWALSVPGDRGPDPREQREQSRRQGGLTVQGHSLSGKAEARERPGRELGQPGCDWSAAVGELGPLRAPEPPCGVQVLPILYIINCLQL